MTNKTTKNSILLTKTHFLQGLRCSKLLWAKLNKPDLFPEDTIASKNNKDQGVMIGELATKVFPNGMNLIDQKAENTAQKTKEESSKRIPLFEAGVIHKRCYARVDILNPLGDDEWDIIEVKSGTKVKNEHIPDVAFQRYCFEQEGYKIRNCFLMHINNEYVKTGELDYSKIFIQEDITLRVQEFFPQVEEEIQKQLAIIDQEEMPTVSIGSFCDKPHTCGLKKNCWDYLPKENVTELFYGKKLGFDLLDQDILLLKDIPEGTKFKGRPRQQAIQVQCSKEDKVQIDKERIEKFLSDLIYPLHHFDFETFAPPIPIYDGTKPYQKIPFQYSLHIEQEDGSIEHKSFLAKSSDDPREALAKQIIADFEKIGDIIVYNKAFERSVLQKLAEKFPDLSEKLNDLIPRLVDLADVFSNFWYYNPKQKGKYSIKYVLPVLTDISYADMEVGNGEEAFIAFEKANFGDCSEEEKQQIFANLEAYCTQDTWAEVEIVRKLREMLSQK